MKILDTPATLRCSTTPYPWHQRMPSVEEYFYRWVQDQDVHTDLIYLPIFWWNNANAQRTRRQDHDYMAFDEAQQYIDRHVRDDEWYFTISQCDDGVYETLPENVIVFNAGGEGDIPIPLLSDPHPVFAVRPKRFLASFVGIIESGGPVETGHKRSTSSWNVDGRGATTRRKMQAVFSGIKDTLVVDNRGGTKAALELFRETARDSDFGLCPRGYGKTSFRLFEMFWLQAVPVYIYDELWLPYMDVLDWEEFAVLCHASELEQLPTRLASISTHHRETMRACGERLRDEFFTFPGMCRQIVRYLESY